MPPRTRSMARRGRVTRSTRRRVGGRKPRYRQNKSSRYSIVKELNYNGFHCFKEKYMTTLAMTCDGNGDCALTTTVGAGWSSPCWQFKLNQLGDVTNYQNMFDQYRITGVKMKIFPNHTNAAYPGSTTGTDGTGTVTTTYLPQPIPKFWYVYDANDAGNPGSMASAMEKNIKTLSFTDRPISIYIKNPCALSTTTVDPSSAVNITNMTRRPVKSPWLNLDTGIGVGHLGIEMGLFGAQATQRYNPRCVITFYFQTKGNN